MSQSLYCRVQVALGPTEITATTDAVFWQLRDTGSGHSLGLKYDYTANAFKIFLDTGGVITVPWVAIDSVFFTFAIRAIVQTDGTIKVHVTHQSTNYGPIQTPTPVNYDLLRIGAIDNAALETVARSFRGVWVGSTSGGTDIFNSDPIVGLPLVPPFDSTFGGTITVPFSGQITFQNSGDSNAYCAKQIQAVVLPPGIAGLADPGDANVIYAGNTDWAMSGQPSWVVDGWGLDRVIIPMRGSRRTRDTFLSGLQMWMPWVDDPNMFLADITQEQRPGANFPKIDLVFTGKRGGILPPIREQAGEQVQQISGRAWWNITHTVGLTFIGKTSEMTIWSRTPIDLSTVNPLEPAQIDLMWLTETDAALWTGIWNTYESLIETNVNLCFVSRVVSTGVSETVVPGQYYRATKTIQRLYFPIIG